MPNSVPPHFRLGPGIWASISEPAHHDLLIRYTLRARELLAHLQEDIPDIDRLCVIVKAAVEARALLFTAALTEPTAEDLDSYFDEFVTRSAVGIQDLKGARNEN